MSNELNLTEWDQKIIGQGGSILQSSVWAEFQKSLGNKTHFLNCPNFQSLTIELPLPMGKKYLYSPRGPLGNASLSLQEYKKISDADHNIIFSRIEPREHVNLPEAAKEVQPKNNWFVRVDAEEEQMLASMKSKHRYNINVAQRKGVVVREGDKNDLLAVWKLFLETAARNNFHLHPQDYYWQMFDVLAPKYLKILVAEHEGDILAANILTMFGDTVAYPHGGSSSKKKEFMAPYLLHWEGMKIAKAGGFKFYDFGGITNDPNHVWAGITRFKKGFGGFEVDYPGTFDQVFSPLWYNVYKNIRGFRKIFKI